MRVVARLLPTLIALGAALPGSASGARTAPVTVAQDAAVRLQAHEDADGELCVTLNFGEPYGNFECADPDLGGSFVVGDRDGLAIPDGETGDAGPAYVGAFVDGAAATVEVRRDGLLLGSATAVAGTTYRGVGAGHVRFALIGLPAGAATDGLRVRVLDGAGALREALASDDGDGELVTAGASLLSGRAGRTRWKITAERSSVLGPTVLDLEHEVVSTCISVTVGEGDASQQSICTGGPPFQSLLSSTAAQVGLEEDCKPAFRLVRGIVDGDTKAVDVLRGDGRRVLAQTAPVPGASRLAYALAVPADAAVRSVRVTQRDGRTRVLDVSAAPRQVLCAVSDDDILGYLGLTSIFDLVAHPPAITPAGPVTTVAGPPAFRVADGPEGSLCMALGDRPFTALGCHLVSPRLDALAGVVDDTQRPRALVIALPPVVASARVIAKGRAARSVALLPGTGYVGPYAGHVRFAAAALVDDNDRMELFDAAGKLLYRDPAGDVLAPPRQTAVRRIAGRPGTPSLWRTAVRFDTDTTRCLTLTDGRRPDSDASCDETVGGALSAVIGAPCVTRQLSVGVVAPAGSRVTARLSGGRVRALPLKRGAGVLTLARTVGLRSLTVVRRGRSRKLMIDAPAGASQCGWQTGASLSGR